MSFSVHAIVCVRVNSHDGGVIHQDITTKSSAGDGLTHALIDDLGRKIVCPALGTELVAALQARHLLGVKTRFLKSLSYQSITAEKSRETDRQRLVQTARERERDRHTDSRTHTCTSTHTPHTPNADIHKCLTLSISVFRDDT